ncbi:MAG: VWA domain-containing protein [Desulfobacterales bacterium]|nr:MAG: VWA domain-containing protein [Desulfobacterales bacterium]
MILSHLWILNLLWLLPLAAVALIFQSRKKKRALEMFADAHLLQRLTAAESGGRRFFKALMLLLALGLLLFALAGPRWGSHYEEVSQKGVDIMLLVDVSPSMLVEDIAPNRLERARREILDFLKNVQGDRVGLVAFAGAAFIQCPLTLDYAALEMFLNAVQPDLIPVPGTDLGAAIEMGLSAFDEDATTDKVILLITDGEDNEKRGFEAARKAAAKGAKIFVFGIGDAGGGPIPETGGQGGFKKDSRGKMILSKLDEEGLQQIASLTGGTYVRSVAGDLDLDILYFDGIKSHTRAQELKSGKIKVYEERFTFFVLAAFMVLLIEGFIDEKIRSRASGGRKAAAVRTGVVALTTAALCLTAAARTLAAESPDELYRRGRFSEAEKGYAQSDMDHPKDLRYRYNRGCAAYQSGDYEAAAAAFASALRRTEEDEIRFKAAFNLGNAAYQQGDFQTAVQNYKQALALDASSEDARYNLELALRALAKQKDQQDRTSHDQPQQDSGQQQEKSAGDEKQDNQSAQPEDKSAEGEQASDRQKEDESSEGKSEEEKKADETRDKQSQANRQPRPTDQPELSGELKPRAAMQPDNRDEKKAQSALSAMDRKKAEALLNNIQEDRSLLIRLQTSKGGRQGVASGKDW